MNEFENEKIKVAYYGGVIESVEALVDGYKKAIESNKELPSIELLELLANQAIMYAEGKLETSKLGRGYLDSRNKGAI